MLKVINEGRDTLYAAIAEIDPFLAKLEKPTLAAIASTYEKDQDIPVYKAKAQDIVDWFNVSDSPASFIFDFADELPITAVTDIGQYDPKFVEAVFKTGRKLGYIDSEGYDLIDAATGGSKHKLSFVELARMLLIAINKSAVAKNYSKDTPADELDDRTELNPELVKGIFDEIMKNYKSLGESMNEDIPDDASAKPAEAEVAVAEKPDTLDKEEVDPGIIINAVKTSINDLIQHAWDYISDVNSVIATLNYDDYKAENKDKIIEVLNTIVDDVTIDVGMLHKVSNLMDRKESNLLDSGEQKAEEIISK